MTSREKLFAIGDDYWIENDEGAASGRGVEFGPLLLSPFGDERPIARPAASPS